MIAATRVPISQMLFGMRRGRSCALTVMLRSRRPRKISFGETCHFRGREILTMPESKADYWVAWLRHDRAADGCMTHAVHSDSTRALCGVVPTEYAGETIVANGVGCKRCNAALRRRGIEA